MEQLIKKVKALKEKYMFQKRGEISFDQVVSDFIFDDDAMYVIFRNSDEVRKYNMNADGNYDVICAQGGLQSDYNAFIFTDTQHIYISDVFHKRIIKINKGNFKQEFISTSTIGCPLDGIVLNDKSIAIGFSNFVGGIPKTKFKGLYIVSLDQKNEIIEIPYQTTVPVKFKSIKIIDNNILTNDIHSNILYKIDIASRKITPFMSLSDGIIMDFEFVKSYFYCGCRYESNYSLEKFDVNGNLIFKQNFCSDAISTIKTYQDALWILNITKNTITQFIL